MVTHATVASDPQSPLLDEGDWNAAHTVTVRTAAGVPAGAPSGSELPIAFDTTAVSGGLYVWTGAAWVLAAPIPPVITPS